MCRERDAREEKANARRRSRCTPRKKTTTPAGAALHPYKQHSAIVRVHTNERAVVWYSIVLSTVLLGAGRIRSTRRPTQVDDETHRVRRSEQLPILNGLLRRRSGARRPRPRARWPAVESPTLLQRPWPDALSLLFQQQPLQKSSLPVACHPDLLQLLHRRHAARC